MFFGRRFLKTAIGNGGSSTGPFAKIEESEWCKAYEATLITSSRAQDHSVHAPVINLDVPCNLVPSARVGHTHLYIDKEISQEGLFEILEVLAKHGIVEMGYAQATRSRGYSAVRPEWAPKNLS